MVSGYIGIILVPFSIWSALTPNTLIYNLYSSSETSNLTVEEIEHKKEDSDISKNGDIVDVELIGAYNKNLIDRINSSENFIVVQSSSNRIHFKSTGEIYLINDDRRPFIYKSRSGILRLIVLDMCITDFKELSIPAMGPSPKGNIQSEVNKLIDNFVTQNIELVFENINQCLSK